MKADPRHRERRAPATDGNETVEVISHIPVPKQASNTRSLGYATDRPTRPQKLPLSGIPLGFCRLGGSPLPPDLCSRSVGKALIFRGFSGGSGEVLDLVSQ